MAVLTQLYMVITDGKVSNIPYPLLQATVSIDITECMYAARLNPDVAPRYPLHPLKGPAVTPIQLNNLIWVAAEANGGQIPEIFRFGPISLSWTSSPTMGKLTMGELQSLH